MWRRTLPVALAVLLISAALVLTKTGRDALFFQGSGLFYLPRAYMGIALLAMPTALLVLAAMRRYGHRRIRIAGPLVTAAILIAFFVVARPGGGALMTGFFMLIPVTFGVLFSLSWLLAADLLGHLPRSALGRPYSVIGAAAISGGVLGGLVGRGLSMRVEPALFLLIGAGCLVASAVVMSLAQRRFPSTLAARCTGEIVEEDAGMRAQISRVVRRPYVSLLLGISVTAALTGILIEFQFYLAAATSGRGGQENAALFSTLYTVLNLGALLVQLLLVPELQRWIGIGGSLLILPAALVGGAAALFANSSLLMRSGLKAAEGGLKSSIHRSSWEQVFLPLADQTRTTAKLLVDGMASRLGEGVAAGIVFVWLAFVARGEIVGRSTAWITIFLLGSAALWFWLVRRLGRRIELEGVGRERREKGERGEGAEGAGFRPDLLVPDG